MSELFEQALDNDLIKRGLLATAVDREATGVVQFEDAEFNVKLEHFYERNTRCEGEYYVVSAAIREVGERSGRTATTVERDRGKAEAEYERLMKKYGLTAQTGDGTDTPHEERESYSLYHRLRERLRGDGQGEEGGGVGSDADSDEGDGTGEGESSEEASD